MSTDVKKNAFIPITTRSLSTTRASPTVPKRTKRKPAQPWVPGKTTPTGEQIAKPYPKKKHKYSYLKINKGIKIDALYVGRETSTLVTITRGGLSLVLFLASIGIPFALYYVALSF